jgi:hypothetical protein
VRNRLKIKENLSFENQYVLARNSFQTHSWCRFDDRSRVVAESWNDRALKKRHLKARTATMTTRPTTACYEHPNTLNCRHLCKGNKLCPGNKFMPPPVTLPDAGVSTASLTPASPSVFQRQRHLASTPASPQRPPALALGYAEVTPSPLKLPLCVCGRTSANALN